MNRIEQLVEKYHLHPHPEGGHFAENVQAVSISCWKKMISHIFMSLTVMKSGISMKDVE